MAITAYEEPKPEAPITKIHTREAMRQAIPRIIQSIKAASVHHLSTLDLVFSDSSRSLIDYTVKTLYEALKSQREAHVLHQLLRDVDAAKYDHVPELHHRMTELDSGREKVSTKMARDALHRFFTKIMEDARVLALTNPGVRIDGGHLTAWYLDYSPEERAKHRERHSREQDRLFNRSKVEEYRR